MVTVNIQCPFCGKYHSVEVSTRGYALWRAGELIQIAMPELSATKREQLISGICPSCQKSFFGEEEEEEGDDIDACMRDSLESTGQWW